MCFITATVIETPCDTCKRIPIFEGKVNPIQNYIYFKLYIKHHIYYYTSFIDIHPIFMLDLVLFLNYCFRKSNIDVGMH